MPKALAFTLPESLAKHVTHISEIATFGAPKRHTHTMDVDPVDIAELSHRAAQQTLADSNDTVVPKDCDVMNVTSACYRALYGFDTYQPIPASPGPHIGMYV